MSKINFYTADKAYLLKDKTRIKNWIKSEASLYNKEIGEINFIFCSDEYLLEINKKYLNHFTFTDVITFDNSEEGIINGEVYISIDRIKENAKSFNVTIKDELLRIFIHGILHLFGYTDKTKEERSLMTDKENEALRRF